MRAIRALLPLFLPFFCVAGICSAQLSDRERAAVSIEEGFKITANITCFSGNNYEAKLDVYRPREAQAPTPALMLIHGGGGVAGEKEQNALEALPYWVMGFSVVNVEYRLAKVSLAPAAVEDCLCARLWIGRNGQKYNFDMNKPVGGGGSAGGHLALTTGRIPSASGLDAQCAFHDDWNGAKNEALPKVAAIVNGYGITGVANMLQGPNMRS